MRIIVTGGSGYIGSAIVNELVRDGHEVIVLSRNPQSVTGLPGGARAERWDGRTAAGWGELSDGAGAIINLAGERMAGPSPAYRWTEKRKRLICDSRRNAGQAVNEAVRAASQKPGVLIQMSGSDYYASGDEVRTESSPPGKGFLSYVCDECWEPSTKEVEAMGVRRAVIRTGPVLGPDSAVLNPLVLQHQLFVGGRIGSGQQWISWVHIADVVGAVRFLLGEPQVAGVFNLCAPNPVTNAVFSKTLGKVLGRPSWLPAPAFAFRLAFGEMATTLLEGARAKPEQLQSAGYHFLFPELEPALREILNK